MESKQEIKVYKIHYKCPSCKEGNMIFDGTSYLSYPAKHSHKCSNNECGHVEKYLKKQYPTIEYE